jgi:hypothetical protein
MKYKNIIPAVPGTTVIHYNGYHDSTQEEAVLFWAACYEDGDPEPFIVPFTFDPEGGQATRFDIPEGGEDGRESLIIAFNIPGWGRITACEMPLVFGQHLRQVKGFDPNF